MKLKLITSVILLVASFIQVYGQDRVNRQKLTFNTVSGIMTNASGWAYNSTLGEWIEYNNVISDNKDYKIKYKSLQGQYMMSQTAQNFLNIQTKTLIFNDTDYYVLIIEKWNGRYDYPTIRKDWYAYKETVGFIFSKSDYLKLENIEGVLELKTKMTVSMGSKYETYDETVFLDLIQTKLATVNSEYSLEYTFPITKSKEGAIRFYIPECFFSYLKYDFEVKYFETDYENFKNILIK